MLVLADAELLVLVAGGANTDSPSYDARLAAACGLLERSGGMEAALRVLRPRSAELLGPAGALALAAAAELGRRTTAGGMVRGARLLFSRTVAEHFGPLLRAEKRELFYALLVDTRNRLISKVRVSEGSLAASLVHPREAFGAAVRETAAAYRVLTQPPQWRPRAEPGGPAAHRTPGCQWTPAGDTGARPCRGRRRCLLLLLRPWRTRSTRY